MKTLKTWNREKNKFETIVIKSKSYGKSDTDKSKYRPNISDLTGASGNARTGLYDFKDGKDNGIRFYTLRNKGADIVEMENYAKREIERGDEIKKQFMEDALADLKANANGEPTENKETTVTETTKTE